MLGETQEFFPWPFHKYTQVIKTIVLFDLTFGHCLPQDILTQY